MDRGYSIKDLLLILGFLAVGFLLLSAIRRQVDVATIALAFLVTIVAYGVKWLLSRRGKSD